MLQLNCDIDVLVCEVLYFGLRRGSLPSAYLGGAVIGLRRVEVYPLALRVPLNQSRTFLDLGGDLSALDLRLLD